MKPAPPVTTALIATSVDSVRFDRNGVDLVCLGRQAPSCCQIELPAMHLACQDFAVELAELAQIRLPVRASNGHSPLSYLEVAAGCLRFRVIRVGVLHAFLGKAREEGIDELIEGPDARCREPHTEEEAVDPVHLPVANELLQDRTVDREDVPTFLAVVSPHLAGAEVDDQRLIVDDVYQDGSTDTCRDVVR